MKTSPERFVFGTKKEKERLLEWTRECFDEGCVFGARKFTEENTPDPLLRRVCIHSFASRYKDAVLNGYIVRRMSLPIRVRKKGLPMADLLPYVAESTGISLEELKEAWDGS